MKIQGKVIEYKEFEVDKAEVVKGLLQDYGWRRKNRTDSFITIREVDGIESIVSLSDHSYHGSPDYRIDTVISNNAEDIKLFKLLSELEKIIQDRASRGID